MMGMIKQYAAGRSALGEEILRNLRKDFLVEFRSRFALNVSIAFAVIATVSLSLTAGGTPFSPLVQSILLWIIIFFSAMNGLSHIFVREEDQATSLFLRITVSVDSVFISKFLYNQIFMMIIIAVVTPLFLFFLQIHVALICYFICTAIAGGMAIASCTTIVAAMVAKAGGRGSLFSILSFPLLLPVLWVSISSTRGALDGSSPAEDASLVFLLAFSGFISAISFLLFRFVWIEE
jgi:heme exporter protein B